MKTPRSIITRRYLAAIAVFVAIQVWPSTLAADARAQVVACAPFDHAHRGWTGLLARFVRGGEVDYAGIRRDRSGALRSYLAALAGVCEGQYESWTRAQRLAYWINTYNAYTIRLILDHHPVSSIRTIGSQPDAAFKQKVIPSAAMRDHAMSLEDVEHGVLRKEFTEPRIHFAIVCAAKSCPALRPEAYRAAVLEVQLREATRAFLADHTKNRFDAPSRTMFLSQIFKWFRVDFERAAGSLAAFIRPHLDPALARVVGSGPLRTEFLNYDWSLNGK